MATREPIATHTLGSPANSILFSSILDTWTDLELEIEVASVSGSQFVYVKINGDTGTNYSMVNLRTDGSGPASGFVANDNAGYMTGLAALQGNVLGRLSILAHFMQYANPSIYKPFLVRAGNAAAGNQLLAEQWRSNSAITSLEIGLSGTSLTTGSVATLFGIKCA